MVLPNDQLRQALGKSARLNDVLDASNQHLLHIINCLMQMLSESELINIDFNDFQTLIQHLGMMQTGFAYGYADTSLPAGITLKHVSLASAKGALLHIWVG
jgi:cell division protein FtsZ